MKNVRLKRLSGFSLYEVLIAVAVFALVAVMAVPQVQRASFRSKLAAEKANIALIQSAKEAYMADNPGMELTSVTSLLPYLPDQQMLESPFGTEYKNLTDLNRPIASGSKEVTAPSQAQFVAIAKSEATGFSPLDGGIGSGGPVAVLTAPTSTTPTTTTPTTPTTPVPPTEEVTPTPEVVVTDDGGGVTPVNANPVVLLTAYPITTYRGVPVALTAAASDSDGDSLTYTFTADGVSFPAQAGNTLSLAFPSLGNKALSVSVSDGKGGLVTASSAVEIINQVPTVTLTASSVDAKLNEAVTFTAVGNDLDNDPLEYRFEIDGVWGGWSPSNIASKTWDTEGSKTAKVEVRDPYSGSSSQSIVVEVGTPEFVFYWNNGVNPVHTNSVIMSAANAGQHNNFNAVMAAINSVGANRVQNAISAGGATQQIVGARTAETGESLSYSNGWIAGYSGGWLNHYSGAWNVHVGTYGESKTVSLGGKLGGRTSVRSRYLHYTYRNAYYYRHAYWHRTVTATKTVSEYQSRVMQANSIVGINAKTGEVVTIPASQWASVMAGNVKVNGQSVKVAGYAGMQSGAEEFLVRQYTQSRAWNEHYASTLDHYHTATEHIGSFNTYSAWQKKHPVTISFIKGGDFLSGEWRNLANRKPVESAKRSFNLDGTGDKDWEWVGATEGILVVNEAKDPAFQPDGTHFFGHNTWGQKWNNATEPMKTLDKDNDGFLTESELDTVWVWVDANTDAIVQQGELTTLPEKGITSISVNNQEDGKGGEWFPGGATGPAGTFDMVDWWSVR